MFRIAFPWIAAVLALAGSAAAQTPTPPPSKGAASETPVDPVTVTGQRDPKAVVVCEERVITGSRRTRKVCSTVGQIDAQRTASREFLEDSSLRAGRVKGEEGGTVSTASSRPSAPAWRPRQARPRPAG